MIEINADMISVRPHDIRSLSPCLQSVQGVLSGLTPEELYKFKVWFYQWEPAITQQQVMDGDLLDFVDRIMEILGKKAIVHAK